MITDYRVAKKYIDAQPWHKRIGTYALILFGICVLSVWSVWDYFRKDR